MIRSLLLTILLLLTISIATYAQGAGTASSIYRSTFANLGSPVDGSVRYCTNCIPNTTPATSGGTGAFVDRVNGVWIARASAASGGGTVTSVSVVTANGLSGTVATATTTPAITLNVSALDAAKIADGSVSNTEFQRLDGVTSGIQTQFSGKVSGPASAVDNHLAVFDGTTGKLIKDGGVIPSGITNSAGANVVPKSNGTNLVASQITDDGANVLINTLTGGLSVTGASGASSTITHGTSGFSISGPDGDNNAQVNINGTILELDGSASAHIVTSTESFNMDGAAHTITNTAATSISNGTPLWGAGSSGIEFQVNAVGDIVTYHGGSPADGQLLIGNTGASKFAANNLTPGTGISIVNGAASVTIAADHTNLGTVLPVDMSNGVLSTATGAVYSSPGTTAGLTAGTEGSVSFPVPRGGTIRNLYVRTGTTAKVNTPSTLITIRKNGADTAVTVTMTQTTLTTTSDTTHSFTVVAGDLITISFLTTGVAAVSTSIAGVSFELD